jgi:hypothetical protein
MWQVTREETGPMRSLSAFRASVHERADRDRTGTALSLIAFFSAFTLIAAIALGTTSVHPF